MHQQIKTSPGSTDENLQAVIDTLGGAGINIQGIGPDFESPHIRTVVSHEDTEAAISVLRSAGLEPEIRPGFTASVANRPGRLKHVLDALRQRGYGIESVLVLADRTGEDVLVSVGIDRPVPNDWVELGGFVIVEETHRRSE